MQRETHSKANPAQNSARNTRRWVSDRTLAIYFEVSRATIWRWVKLGKLPSPEKIGPNCTRFDLEKIQAEESAA